MKAPPFIKPYVATNPAADPVLEDVLSNWLKTYRYIVKLKPTDSALRCLARMIAIEYKREPGPRMHIVVRLHGRFSRLRYDLERCSLATK